MNYTVFIQISKVEYLINYMLVRKHSFTLNMKCDIIFIL